MMLAFTIHVTLSLIVAIVAIRNIGGIPENAFTLFTAFVAALTLFWLLYFVFYRRYFNKFPHIINLILFFLKEFLMANLFLAYEITRKGSELEPAVVAIPLDVKSDLEILILSNLITLTPGTLPLDITEDRKTLFIHATFVKGRDTGKIKDNIKKGFERKILRITR